MTQEERCHFLSASDEELSAESMLDFHKASGHGGQKVNKTSSAVRITHKPTGIVVTASGSRSQTENRKEAFRKLRFQIALTCRISPAEEPDIAQVPSVSNQKTYLPWLAKLLDCLVESGRISGLSRSAFTKLLQRDPDVWRYVRESQISLPSKTPLQIPDFGEAPINASHLRSGDSVTD